MPDSDDLSYIDHNGSVRTHGDVLTARIVAPAADLQGDIVIALPSDVGETARARYGCGENPFSPPDYVVRGAASCHRVTALTVPRALRPVVPVSG